MYEKLRKRILSYHSIYLPPYQDIQDTLATGEARIVEIDVEKNIEERHLTVCSRDIGQHVTRRIGAPPNSFLRTTTFKHHQRGPCQTSYPRSTYCDYYLAFILQKIWPS
jgi:hypothetical protein